MGLRVFTCTEVHVKGRERFVAPTWFIGQGLSARKEVLGQGGLGDRPNQFCLKTEALWCCRLLAEREEVDRQEVLIVAD
jgi:hypothetical protein